MRGMGKPAVTGVQSLVIDSEKEEIRLVDNGDLCLKRGDVISIDGSTGLVFRGEVPCLPSDQDTDFQVILRWAGKYKRMQVLANADTVEEVQRAIELGAEGVGLCRTEHMFFKSDRINLFRRMILVDDSHQRQQALDQIRAMQQEDFEKIFRLLDNMEIIIRLLDPPLHEFFPSPSTSNFDSEMKSLAENLELPQGQIMRQVQALQETNPMLGFRGCRLTIIHPEIAEMQVKAITGT